jgi:predicted GH43/DUF377 family glycosyl hydrolase
MEPLLVFGLLALALILVFILVLLLRAIRRSQPIRLERLVQNPLLSPLRERWWESEAVFNPAAVVHDGRVHLFYRALGADGISRIGHASSPDGIHFDERATDPIFAAETPEQAQSHWPYTSPARLVYDTQAYASGGGWGGCEDPRAVKIDGDVYMTFNMFNGWESLRTAFTCLEGGHLSQRNWFWKPYQFLSRPGDRQKNWVLFPEKINGKFALFHNLDKGNPSKVHVAYLDELDMWQAPAGREAPDPQQLPDHHVAWHNRTRSAACPPIKTDEGWLLLYHAMDAKDHSKYKVGAMLLDLNDPEKVLYRSPNPILESEHWYENDWKPGIVYASGGVVLGDDLLVYYGGGDKYIAGAKTNLKDFLRQLKRHEQPELFPMRYN